MAFMRGAGTAVRTILAPVAWKTASNEAVKFQRLSSFSDDDTSAHAADTAGETCRDRRSDPPGGQLACISGLCADAYWPASDDGREEAGDERKAEMTSDDAIRASDCDRELAAEVLRDAYVVGRLDLEEFHDRAGAAYSAKTWGELRDLTADLPTRQVLSRAASGADSHSRVVRLAYAPWRPFARIWVMAVIWLAIAVAARTAAAMPLVLLSLFVLRAARWTMPPEQPPQCRAHPSGAHAGQTQPLGPPKPSDMCLMTGSSARNGTSAPTSCGCRAAATTSASS
jgi:uncharacterized protein DUF1707